MSNSDGFLIPTGTEAKVCQLIALRQKMGLRKYGTTVQDNPLPLAAWLQHALEEAMDFAIYLQRAIDELEIAEKLRRAEQQNTSKP